MSLSQWGPAHAVGQSRGSRAGLGLDWDERTGRGSYDQTSFGPVSLTGIDAVPVRGKLNPVAITWLAAVRAAALGHISGLCGSACEQFALLGPIQ